MKLISGDINGLGIVWDLKTGEQIMTLTQEEGRDALTRAITGLAYSPDGRYLALASQRDFASVFDASNGKLFLTLKGHTSGLRSISFSPDGKQIATSSMDGKTRMWDATSGENLLMLPVAGNVSFVQGGKQLAIGTESGLYGFVLAIDDLIALAKSRLTRTLTPDECQQYLRVEECSSMP
jgi:WD40 repeat protein